MTTVYESMVSAAIGFSFGMNGQCARLGGPVQYDDRLEVDFDAQFDSDVEVQGDIKYRGHPMYTSLWSDSSGWASGDITVDGLSDYRIFMVRMDGQGTMILAMLGVGDLTSDPTYFRGMGGYAASSTNELNYYISATLSGDTLTMVDCHSINASGTRTAGTVIEIIGII